MATTQCPCQRPGGLNSGVKGVLSTGERCGTCKRFQSDEIAALFLRTVKGLERVTVYIEVAGLIPPCVREARLILSIVKGEP